MTQNSATSSPAAGKANYGIDAPVVIKRFLMLGTGSLALAFGLMVLVPGGIARPFFWMACSMLLSAAVMLWGSKVGKLNLRDKVVASLNLKGHEQVLDAGCGHGLMLVAAAKKLTSGRATGIDIWQQEDQAGNSPEATLKNAHAEGVADKVEIKNGDLRDLPFADSTFDAVLSSWVIHNIYDAPGREKALKEIARVLKPGGRLAIADIRHSAEYAKVLSALGLEDVKRSGPNFLFFIPTHTVTARKP